MTKRKRKSGFNGKHQLAKHRTTWATYMREYRARKKRERLAKLKPKPKVEGIF